MLGAKTLEEAESMTLREYSFRQAALDVKRAESRRLACELAFIQRAAESNDGKKYTCKQESDLYDFEKSIDEILGIETELSPGLENRLQAIRRQNEQFMR